MQDFSLFLGRFHVLVLHLPIGIGLATVLLEAVGRSRKRRALTAALPVLWGLTATSAILTVMLGWLHFAEGGFSGDAAVLHRALGIATAVVAVCIWALAGWYPPLHRRLAPAGSLVFVLLLFATGHYGGNLTHGETYLAEYLPNPLRAAMGLGPRRAPVTDLAQADPWADIVGPMLESRCGTCHNDNKRNGELSLASLAALRAGGETGSVVVPGNPAASELLRRVSLPASDEAFMPAEGKTPLTAAQVGILRWWIEAGAPAGTLLGELSPMLAVAGPTVLGADIAAALSIEVGLAAAPAGLPGEAVARAADAGLTSALAAAGFLVRQVSQSNPGLIVSVHSVGNRLTAEQLAVLATAAEQVVDLDLQATGLDDAGAETLAGLTGLVQLKLSRNALTAAGVAALGALGSLQVLNLYGNAGIDDSVVDDLAALPALERVYLWQTGMSPAGLARLTAARPGLVIEAGISQTEANPPAR